jgi:hypothetical protein
LPSNNASCGATHATAKRRRDLRRPLRAFVGRGSGYFVLRYEFTDPWDKLSRNLHDPLAYGLECCLIFGERLFFGL